MNPRRQRRRAIEPPALEPVDRLRRMRAIAQAAIDVELFTIPLDMTSLCSAARRWCRSR